MSDGPISRPNTRSERVITGPSDSAAARSTTLRSSRTLPGHAWLIIAAIASCAERHRHPAPRRDLAQEVLDQRRDVLAALAQRRQLDVDDREPEVEVLAERARR